MGGRTLVRGGNNEVGDPPSPPLVRGGGLVGGRTLVRGGNNEVGDPPSPPLVRGGGLVGGRTLVRGGNNEVGDPPSPPLVRGGGLVGGRSLVRGGIRARVLGGSGEGCAMARYMSSGGGVRWRGSRLCGGLAGVLLMLVAAAWGGGGSPVRAAGQQPADRDRVVSEVTRRLKACDERIAKLGASLLAEIKAHGDPHDETLNQMITEKSADASFRNATLAREIAEIAVMEYVEGIAKQEEATLEGEIKLAESEAGRAKDFIEMTRHQLTRAKEASNLSAADLAVEFAYEDAVVEAELREPKARLELEKAQSRLKLLREYTKPKTIKTLQAEVEKARVDEQTKKAVWQLEKAKADRLMARELDTHTAVKTGDLLAALSRAGRGHEDPGWSGGPSEEGGDRTRPGQGTDRSAGPARARCGPGRSGHGRRWR